MRPALGGENLRNRPPIGGIPAKPVHRLRPERDKATCPQNTRGLGDPVLVCREA